MRITIVREYINMIRVPNAILKIFKGLFKHENDTRRIYAVLLDHENRIRTLEGKATINEQQFRNAIENLDQIDKKQFITGLKNL